MPVRAIDDSDNFIIRRAAIAQAPMMPLQSLAVLISPQLRQQFSKKLFSGDATRFDKLLAQLETAPNWRAAYRLLEHCFYRQQISPYAIEATRFSDLIYKRYYPNDVYV
ncbi:MAG: hypothetical protein ALAOOOJD_00717 [bacterium]|nr:hypothetical protein [bacterium]